MENRDIRELVEPLRRGWWIVASIALAISAITYLHYRGSPPTYTASTTVYVQASPLDALLGGGAATTDANRTVNNQARLLETPAVANEVAREVDFQGDPRALLELVNTTAAEDSDFVQIEATASDPQFAAAVANGFAESFVRLGRRQLNKDATRAREQIEGELSQLAPGRQNSTVRRDLQGRLAQIAAIEAVPTEAARQIEHALPPAQESGAKPIQAAIFAGLLGTVLGGVLIYGLAALDRRVSPSNVEAEYELPVLASIPFDGKAAAELRRQELRVPMVEPVRTLRTALDHDVQGGTAPRTILVMSAIPEEGKSTLTKGLALGFQGSGRNVLVVDANLRDPVLDEWFSAQRAPGLTDILRSETTPELAVQEASIGDDSAGEVHFDGRIEPEPESVVTSAKPGSEVHEASRVRGSTKIRAKYLRPLEEEEDWDVLPGPALQPVDSPPGLSGSVDGDASSTSAWGGGTAQSGNGNGRAEPVLHLISSGGRVPDPGALLGTAQLARFLSQAKVAYDVVLVDSSPLLAVSDAIPLAAAVDGVIVVSRSNLTTRDDAQRLRRALDRLSGVTVLGLVLNCDRDSHAPRHHYYDAGYT